MHEAELGWKATLCLSCPSFFPASIPGFLLSVLCSGLPGAMDRYSMEELIQMGQGRTVWAWGTGHRAPEMQGGVCVSWGCSFGQCSEFREKG